MAAKAIQEIYARIENLRQFPYMGADLATIKIKNGVWMKELQKNCDGPWININEYDANIYMATLAGYLFQIHGNIEIGINHSGKFFYPYTSVRNQKATDKQIYLHIAM